MEDIWNKIERVRNNTTALTLFQSYFLTLFIYTYTHVMIL